MAEVKVFELGNWVRFRPSRQKSGAGFVNPAPFSTIPLAEGVGFEPTIPGGIAAFKTAAIVHSAIPPSPILSPGADFF